MQRRGYLDFDLEIGASDGLTYPVSARSRVSEAHEDVRFPLDQATLESRLQAP